MIRQRYMEKCGDTINRFDVIEVIHYVSGTTNNKSTTDIVYIAEDLCKDDALMLIQIGITE